MPSSSTFKLPALGGGFALPKLGLQPSSTVPTSALASFANAQLKNFNQSNDASKSLMLPKLFPSSSEQKLLFNGVKSEKIIIDLKSSLVPEAEQQKISRSFKPEVKSNDEIFTPQFVDCDFTRNVSAQDFEMEDHCERLTLKQLKLRFKNCQTSKFSPVGKILRLKYRRKVTNVRHGYEFKHFIERFAFDTPSPDDKILAHLHKIKK